jgi:hypothetical protein
MSNCPSLETKSEALRLRGILVRVSDISYSFSKLNKEYPLDHQDQQSMEALIRSYHSLLHDLFLTLQSYQEEFSDQETSAPHTRKATGSSSLGVATNV